MLSASYALLLLLLFVVARNVRYSMYLLRAHGQQYTEYTFVVFPPHVATLP